MSFGYYINEWVFGYSFLKCTFNTHSCVVVIEVCKYRCSLARTVKPRSGATIFSPQFVALYRRWRKIELLYGISVHRLSRALREGCAISGFHCTLLYYIVYYSTHIQLVINMKCSSSGYFKVASPHPSRQRALAFVATLR